jgi:hypothetical protein
MGASGQHHAPVALYPRGKNPRYPLDRRLGGPQSRSVRRGYKKNPLPLSGPTSNRRACIFLYFVYSTARTKDEPSLETGEG